MSNGRVPKVKYSLLNNESRLATVNKSLVLGLVLIIGGFILVGIFYMIEKHNEETSYYLQNNADLQVPEFLMRRASIYNNKSLMSYIYKPLHYEPKHKNVNVYKLVCYYNFPDEGEAFASKKNVLYANKINPHLCTHINLGFVNVQNNSIYVTPLQLNISLSVIELKKINPDLKVLLSIGGAVEDYNFAHMVLNHENRKWFIKSVLYYIKEYKFDGIDLDWEFPNESPGNDTRQRIHFTQLLQELRKEINRQEKHKFLVSVAVPAPIFLVDNCYDVPYINQYVDFINLMSYDYHFYTKFTPFTGINSPLYSRKGEIDYFASLNINYSTHYWNFKGMDKEKIMVGLPTYGHSFRLRNQLNNKVGAPASGYGKLGHVGFVDYASTCTFLEKNNITPIFDDNYQSPYATKFLEWLSFDNVKSLQIKADFIRKHNFGGAMIYSLNTDDHIGACNMDNNNKNNHRDNNDEDDDDVRLDDNNKRQLFPLVQAIKNILNDPQL